MAEERRPSNSHKSRENNETKLEKVVSGDVVRKEKSAGKKFLDRFVENDAETIGSYIVDEIVIPTIKDLLRDVMNNTVDMFLYGESGGSRGRGHNRGSNTRVSYSDYYRSGNRDRDRDSERRANVRKSDVDDITFDSRVDAEVVMDALYDSIDQYGSVSVAEFYSVSGVSSTWTDSKYGWYNLNTARVESTRGGRYIIRLPKPQPLD